MYFKIWNVNNYKYNLILTNKKTHFRYQKKLKASNRRIKKTKKITSLLTPGNGVEASWTQDIEEVSIKVEIEGKIEKPDVNFEIHPKRLSLKIKDKDCLNGNLNDVGEINIDGCYWYLESSDRELSSIIIVLQKKEIGFKSFENILISDPTDLTITDYIYMDINVDNEYIGKMVFELYGKECPEAVQNFKNVLTGRTSLESESIVELKGSKFKKVIPKEYAIFGPDLKNKLVTEYAAKILKEESYKIGNNASGTLSVNPDKSVSNFYLTFKELPILDEKNLAFGKMKYGYDVLRLIEETGDEDDDILKSDIFISDCGEIPADTVEKFITQDRVRKVKETT